IGPLWARWERSPYLRHLRWLRAHQWDAAPVVQARQWTAVRNLLRHAYASVPFYRRRFDERGIDPARITSFADYRRVPTLTKKDIRSHEAELISRRYAGVPLTAKKTSGSTGTSLRVWVDEDSMQWKRACTIRSDEWSGWRFGQRIARLW